MVGEEEKSPVRVVAYITRWCPDCIRSRRVLQRAGVSFAEIDIEETDGAENAMKAINGGSGKVPTILIDTANGRKILIEPNDPELQEALREARLC